MKKIKDREKIPAMYQSGLSCLDISRKVGLTRGAVYSILKARNIVLRTNEQGLKLKYPKGRFGSNAARWKGGRRRTGRGYIRAYNPQHPNADKTGYVMEHRLVVENILGRLLKKEEDVHHINWQRDDNRPENLEVLSRSEHTLKHSSKVNKVNIAAWERRDAVLIEKKRLQKLLTDHGIAF